MYISKLQAFPDAIHLMANSLSNFTRPRLVKADWCFRLTIVNTCVVGRLKYYTANKVTLSNFVFRLASTSIINAAMRCLSLRIIKEREGIEIKWRIKWRHAPVSARDSAIYYTNMVDSSWSPPRILRLCVSWKFSWEFLACSRRMHAEARLQFCGNRDTYVRRAVAVTHSARRRRRLPRFRDWKLIN